MGDEENDNMGMIENLEDVWNIDYDDLEFGELLGEGAFGSVHTGMYFGTEVAIKRLFEDDTQDTELFIQREINVLQGMRHPNIVQFIGLARHPQYGLHIVTELVKAGDLRKLLKDQKTKIPWSSRAVVAHSAACAMAYLHSRNIIHRDLKSKNLLVDNNFKVKICDFGFARTTSKGARPMTLCGTDDWMAPEIILGYPYSMAADVFSFGIVLCELITRKKISQDLQRSPMDAFGLSVEKFQKLIPADCPTEFAMLAIECCSHEPNDRPTFPALVKKLNQMAKDLAAQEKKAKETAPPESVAKFAAYGDQMKKQIAATKTASNGGSKVSSPPTSTTQARTASPAPARAATATSSAPRTSTTTTPAASKPPTTTPAAKPPTTTTARSTTTTAAPKPTTTTQTRTASPAPAKTTTTTAAPKPTPARTVSTAAAPKPTTTTQPKTTTYKAPTSAAPARAASPAPSTSTASSGSSNGASSGGLYSFAQLKNNPPADVDRTDLPRFLKEDEFQKYFGMSKTAYYGLPKWKQTNKKREVGLF